jgi:hypothetical protein
MQINKEVNQMVEIFIKKAHHEMSPCLWERKNDDCSEWADWNIEGDDYCQAHAEKVIEILKQYGFEVEDRKIKWMNKVKERRINHAEK